MKQKLDKEDQMYEQIERCDECNELSDRALGKLKIKSVWGDGSQPSLYEQTHCRPVGFEEYITENGECVKDEETTHNERDNSWSEGEQEYEIICSKCKASWIWSKSWTADNGGETIYRNGIQFN